MPGFWSSKQALDWVDAAKGDVSAAAWTQFEMMEFGPRMVNSDFNVTSPQKKGRLP